MSADDRAQAIAMVVEAAPPLTEDQRAVLSRLLTPAEVSAA